MPAVCAGKTGAGRGDRPPTEAQDSQVTALHAACSKGDLATVQLLLDAGCSVDATTRCGLTALQCAAGCGHADTVRHLASEGASLDLQGTGGRTAVVMAAENGHLDCVTALLEANADLTLTTEKGLSALCVAVLNDHTEVALTLLRCEPSCVNVLDGANSLPLHYAVRNGNPALVTALLAAGSRRNALNKGFESPVHLAVVGGNLEVLQLLVTAGCDVNLCETTGNVTPLHVAVNMHSDIALFRPMLRLLLAGGCVLNWRAFGTLETPLYRSLGLEKTSFSRELVSHGSNPNLASPFDITALQRACQKGNINLVHLLLNCGIHWKRERWLARYHTACTREITQLLRQWRDNAAPLQALCRITVRNTIEERLEWTLSQLPLPQKVRDYILLRDLV